MYKKTTLFFLIIFIVISSAKSIFSDTYIPFNSKLYPQSNYLCLQKEIKRGDLTIQIIQVESKKKKAPERRAWLSILKNSNLIYKKYYSDISAVGSTAGVFFPAIQPEPFLAVIKKGDYDGRLFLISPSGNVFELKGGDYFVSQDKTFLFSIYESDIPYLTIFNLQTEKIVFSSGDIPMMYQWYIKEKKYFFTKAEWSKLGNGYPTENKKEAYSFDETYSKMTKIEISPNTLKTSTKISITQTR